MSEVLIRTANRDASGGGLAIIRVRTRIKHNLCVIEFYEQIV